MSIAEIFRTLEYGPAPESTGAAEEWLDRHGRRFGHFIDGEWREAQASFETRNPARDTPLAQVGQGTPDDIAAAVAAARAALPAWSGLTGQDRKSVV